VGHVKLEDNMNKTFRSRLDYLEAQLLKAMQETKDILTVEQFNLAFSDVLVDPNISAAYSRLAESKKLGQNSKIFVVNARYLDKTQFRLIGSELFLEYRGRDCTVSHYGRDKVELKLYTSDPDDHILIPPIPTEEKQKEYARLGGSGRAVEDLKGQAKAKELKVLRLLDIFIVEWMGYNKTPAP